MEPDTDDIYIYKYIYFKTLSGLLFGFVRQKEKLAKGNKMSDKSHLGSVFWYY